MKLIAHRGIWKDKKDKNSLKAINRAISSNYIGFECDVRETKDKNYIINHDAIYNGKLIKRQNKNYFKNEY